MGAKIEAISELLGGAGDSIACRGLATLDIANSLGHTAVQVHEDAMCRIT